MFRTPAKTRQNHRYKPYVKHVTTLSTCSTESELSSDCESTTSSDDFDSQLFKTEEECNEPYINQNKFETVRLDHTSPVYRICSSLTELYYGPFDELFDEFFDELPEYKESCEVDTVKVSNLPSFSGEVKRCIELHSKKNAEYDAYSITIRFDGVLTQDHKDILDLIIYDRSCWKKLCYNADQYSYVPSVENCTLSIEMRRKYEYLKW